MNTKIVLSAISITSALALMGGATLATFSSAASSTGNTFAAGNMVLKLNGFGGSTSTPVFTVAAAKPGDISVAVIELTNTGSVAAGAASLEGITLSSPSTPDLAGQLTLNLYNDVNDNGALDDGIDTLIHSALLNADWSDTLLGFGLAASTGHHKVIAKLTFNSGADNTYQGTHATFALNFREDQ